jgi:coatomer subunit beta'
MYVEVNFDDSPDSGSLQLQVYWSPTGALVAIASEESFYILRFNRDAYIAKVDAGADLGDEGVEEAFEILTEVSEK